MASRQRSVNASRIRSDLAGSSWLILIVFSFGLLTASCFFYVAVRSRRRPWKIAAAIYGLLSLAMLVDWLVFRSEPDKSPPALVFLAMLVILWIGGFANALLINPEWLRVRRRLRAGVPAVPPGRVPVEQPMRFDMTSTTEDALAESGIDLNEATPAQLARLAGIGDDLASRLIVEREHSGPYRNGFDVLQRLPIPRGTAEGLLARVTIGVPLPRCGGSHESEK